MSFYLSDKDYKQMIGLISGSSNGKNSDGGSYIDIPEATQESKQQGIVADTVDAVQMGAWQGASDIAHGLGALTGANWLHDIGDWAAKGADENLATMSDEMKSALGQNAFGGEGQGVRNVRWWAGNLGSLIGQNLDAVATLGAGKLATFGAKQAGKLLLKKEAAEEIGKTAVEQAAKRGIPQKYWNMVGITATMSAMSSGSRYGQKRDEVMAMTNEQLSQIPQFSDAYYAIADGEEGEGKTTEEIYALAKSAFADKVGRDAALNPTAIATDLATNAVSGLGGGFWGLGTPAKTVKGGLLKGAIVEGGTEAIQGIGEQYALNKAEQDNYNPNKDLTDGMADNAINGAILGGVFGSVMGALDARTDRAAFNKQKRTLLEHINTGNEAIDNQLRNYIDVINQGASDLDDLVSASRVQALNNAGIAKAQERLAAERALVQQQSKAQFESDFFGEEAPHQSETSAFQVDPNLERALELHSILGQFRKNDLSRANEFIDTPTAFADEQARKDYVTGRAFDEVRNIAQSYGIDPEDGKAMRRWLEDYAAKAKEYANNDPQAVAPVSNLQSSANIAPESRNGVVSGANDEIDVGNGNYQPFQYEVVDASTLTPTQQKDENQFRDRNRASSQAQINNIARNLDPRKLAASPTMDIGAPLLALDGKTIIAGNGRSMAIQQAYQEGGADSYRQFLQDNSAQFGIDPAQLNEMENPVLVRRLTSPVDIAQVAINSNEQGGMRMSDLEQAKVDARRLPSLDSFVANDDGDINSHDNQYFISQFVKNQPENVRNELLDSRGSLSQTGVQRMRNAMLYEAYGDSQTLSRLIENTDQGAKNVLNALTSIAPKVAQTRQGINDGSLSTDINISEDIIQAVEKYNQLNAQGFKIADYLAQNDFVGDLSPEAREILTIFDENRRSGKRIAQVLGSYLNKAEIQGNTSIASLFGDDATFDRLGALQQAKNVSDDYRYSFAGENAKTANKDLLSKAKKAIENGKDAELVRRDTGWFKGSDGKWRFELDDSEITFKTKNIAQSIKGGANLGDLINAEKLFNAYPGLKDVVVKESQSGTYYSPATNEIFFNTNESSNSLKGDLLHEVQHAIQRVENFARGGSPKQFREKVIDRNKILSENEQHFASKSFNKLSAKGKEYARAINRGENVEENYRLLSENPNDKANWADYLHRINSAKEYNQSGADLSVISPLEQYRQLAGEVEARNVESRLSFTDQQRKEISPKITQDIDDQNQVIRYTNGENYTLTESDIAEIEKAQAILNQTFGKAAEHIEVTTFANPPKDVRHLITSDVEGWFNPKTGKVTLIADSINATKTMSKEERLQFVAWHEMAHRGINVGYKGSYDSLMQDVGRNKAISQIADAIQAQRKNTDDLAATNRSVAIEEAIAEIMAANETGKWNELETRYGVEIKKGQRQSAKSWLAMTAQKIKDFLSKFFGVERATQFSDEDVLNLVANVKKSAVGNFNESGNVRFSRNEELTEERYNQAKENGETELTFKQWQQVRSPEFKAWFGDWENDPENASKVINEKTGEPLVVYHGTGREFNTFKKMKTTRGSFFTGETREVESQAFFFSEDYGYSEHVSRVRANDTIEVKPVFLNIRYLNKISDFADISEFTTDTEIDFMDKSIWTYFDDKEFTDKFREEYDGAAFEEDSGEVTYAVFNPNQIKSATDNTGAFSKENDDIRFSRKKLSESDERYLELANKYKDGDLSAESELKAMVDSKANENGFGKPDYRMEHSAPNSKDEISQSIDNLKGLYPDDLYSSKGYQYYGTGYDVMDRKAWDILKRIKGKPDDTVTIYRTYPKGTGGTITNGDWVTIVRDYAVEHGEANLGGDYQIVSKDVKASEVFTNADSLLEQGYDNGKSEVVNDKKKIKLDELITYDDDGNIIPLSKRFNPRKNDVRFSRANTMQSALDLAMTGVADSEPSVWDNLKSKDFSGFKERFNRAMGKVDEWLADSLRPVNDWIDSMHLEDQTGDTSSRDHEKRRLKDAMYTAKGKRDALNSELEQAYLKPILSKIAALSKQSQNKSHPMDELTMKRMVGNWISARYSIEKNIDLLNRDEKVMRDTKRLLDNAKQNGTSAEVRRLNEAYLKAKEQYENRKADIYNTDYKNKGNRFKVGVAGGWSIPEAKLTMQETLNWVKEGDLKDIAEMIYNLNQSRLDIDRASGRYTEAEYQEYKANRHYVPLTGDPNADVDVDIISGAGSNALNIARDKALDGRTISEAEDAIDAVWKSIGKSTTYAGFAEFKSRIDDLFETEVTLLKDKGYSDAEAREQATANLGISKRKMQGLTRSSDNVLIRKEGGDYYEYKLPAQVMESLRNDNVEHANAFLRVISKPTGWYARGVTQWTVTFAPMNMMRDTWEKSEFIRVQKLYDKNNRLVDSKTMDKIGRDTIKNAFADKDVWQATKRLGFGQELRDSVPAERMLKQLLKEGGISNYGTYLDKSETDLIKKLRKENNPIAGKLEKAGKILEGYNKMFDTVSALASYKALVENGIDSKQAAATTLELTNFRKTGSKMRGIKALYMFSQPTVMGAANLVRYLSTRKGQVRFVAYLAGMTALYTVLRSMDDDDEGGNKMDQLGDITRYIPIPIGGGHYFKIPVGFGMAQMAWNFSTNIVKGAVGDISLTEAGANMLVHSLKTFSPVSPSEISAAKYPMEKITLTATPSILQPVMQNVLNRSAFGNKITTNYARDDKLKAEQSKATTAQFWKDTAIELNDTLGIDMHPEQIKNLFDGYSSMLGSLKELNTVFVENPNREDLGRKTRMPFLNQFIGTTNEFAIQSRYYEASEEANQVYKEYKSRKERNEVGYWLDSEKMKLIKFHEEEATTIGKMRSEKAKLTRAMRSGQISAVAYENGIKRYNKEMSQVQAKMLHKYRKMEGLNTN